MGSIYNGAHSCLNQGSGTHRTGLQRHDQATLVEAPIAQHQSGLLKRDQLSMAQGILFGFTSISAMTDGSTIRIQHHRSNRHLPAEAIDLGTLQKHPHPIVESIGLIHSELQQQL